jgi:hypothetical protein
MKILAVFLLSGFFPFLAEVPVPAQSGTLTPIVRVEVLSAAASKTTRNLDLPDFGSTTSTNCTSTADGGMTNCTSSTVGGSSPGFIPISVKQVHILVRMPDGTIVKAQCSSWSSNHCINPNPGQWPAQIGKHDIRLRYVKEGKPEYNSDGTVKKATKLKEEWAKFSFEPKPTVDSGKDR